jgi:hypothetical protein
MVKEPQSFNEVIKNQGWQEAMDKEMESIQKNDTCDLMELLVGKRPIYGKWVYKLKQVPFHVKTYKARLITRGDEQCAGINFEEMFSPILKWGTL